jgi:hypothetical protein
VIESNILPGLFVVTVGTLVAQLTFVIVIFPVAVDAISRGISVLFVSRMTISTFNFFMRKLQGEVRDIVVERLLYEIYNIRVAADVLCVTRRALDVRDVTGPPVKSELAAHILLNVFMAIKAKVCLLESLERFMTI